MSPIGITNNMNNYQDLWLGMASKHGVGVCYVYMCLFQMLSRLKLLLCFCARVVYCVACSQCAFGRRSYSTG